MQSLISRGRDPQIENPYHWVTFALWWTHRWGVGCAGRCGWTGRGAGQCGEMQESRQLVGFSQDWQEATNGGLATSRAPEGDPRASQIQTGSQRPADNTEQMKMNHSPGHRISPPRCPARHWLPGPRVLDQRFIGSWRSLNYSWVLWLNSLLKPHLHSLHFL